MNKREAPPARTSGDHDVERLRSESQRLAGEAQHLLDRLQEHQLSLEGYLEQLRTKGPQ